MVSNLDIAVGEGPATEVVVCLAPPREHVHLRAAQDVNDITPSFLLLSTCIEVNYQYAYGIHVSIKLQVALWQLMNNVSQGVILASLRFILVFIVLLLLLIDF